MANGHGGTRADVGRTRILGFAKTLRVQYERGAIWNEGKEPVTESGETRILPPTPLQRSKQQTSPGCFISSSKYMEQELEFIKKLSWRGGRRSK